MNVASVPAALLDCLAREKGFTVDTDRDPNKIILKKGRQILTIHRSNSSVQVQGPVGHPLTRFCSVAQFKLIMEKFSAD